ncbi:MAG: PhzF family phenazine biosynthesis protein [Pseudomonadota bacterium]
MQIRPFFQVDAFASKPFEGNQACVMPLEDFWPDETLQAIAAENNVAETAYIVPEGENIWKLRWFTPGAEVPLCGHATLAAAHVLYNDLGFDAETITFETRYCGALYVSRKGPDLLEMDFPAQPFRQVEISDALVAALGARPKELWAGNYLAAVFDTPEEVLALTPDYRAMAEVGIAEGAAEQGCVGVLAAGGVDGVDVTSRFFAGGVGIDEDPATGSWHCMLAPLMSEKLRQPTLNCFQAYPGRGAFIETDVQGDRVKLRGTSVTVIEGSFRL